MKYHYKTILFTNEHTLVSVHFVYTYERYTDYHIFSYEYLYEY